MLIQTYFEKIMLVAFRINMLNFEAKKFLVSNYWLLKSCCKYFQVIKDLIKGQLIFIKNISFKRSSILTFRLSPFDVIDAMPFYDLYFNNIVKIPNLKKKAITIFHLFHLFNDLSFSIFIKP